MNDFICSKRNYTFFLFVITADGVVTCGDRRVSPYIIHSTAIFHGCKNVHFQMNIFNIFLIFSQNIDCGYTLESNEYPQSMFWSKHKKKNVYPCKPQFCYIKVGCKGVYITRTCFPDANTFLALNINFCTS